MIKQPEDLIPVAELDSDEHNICVFDDIQLSNADMDNIRYYFFLTRSTKCNAIYLAQGFYNMNRFIRQNTGFKNFVTGLEDINVQKIALEQ